MNKEEAIKYLENFTKYTKDVFKKEVKQNEASQYAIDLENRVKHFETVLNYIENSIPKQDIEDKIRQSEELIDNSQGCIDDKDLYEEYGKIKACKELLEGK